ncbi:MAG: T9SS type A sorting domain-containing protein [Bacteroidia bacterium]|nr:T9SS type A sorting domain-containing protein [Bacteroidia bacterium]
MNKYKYLTLSLLLVLTNFAFAQCGTDERARLTHLDVLQDGQTMADYLEANRGFEFEESYDVRGKKAIRTIPVVFHVVHQYGDENISKEQIEDQLRVLNEDFQRLNADTVNTQPQFKARAANFNIEFKLARVAPDGSCTEGITRHQSDLTIEPDGYDWVKSVVMWDYKKYLNIWVVKQILNDNPSSTLLGYAVFPGDRNASTRDGIVMRSDRVGTIGTAVQSGAGRTLTHEIGHWLGLYHPFQGSWNGSYVTTGCYGNGDRVSDTPPVEESTRNCPTGANTCNTDSPDEVDMVENYMDYSTGTCQNAFTNGQLARANGYLNDLNTRGRNIAASNVSATGVNTNPSCGPIADFWHSSKSTYVCVGAEIDFEDHSYNGAIDDRTWTFEGGTPSVSTYENPTVTYNTPGVYKVELEVSNSDGTDNLVRTKFITVYPDSSAIKASFGEDFAASTSVDGWQLGVDHTWGWRRNTLRGYSGKECLEALNDDETPPGSRYALTLPPVDVSNHGEPIYFSFRHAYARRNTSSSDILLISASENCGDNWRTLKGLNYINGLETGTVAPGWKPYVASHWGYTELDLSAYSNSPNLILRMEVVSQSGNSVFIDDINIGRFPLKVSTYENDVELSIVPNPAQNTVNINLNKNYGSFDVSIVDIAGRLLLQQNLNQNQKTLNTSDLANGVYTVWVNVEGKMWSKKLIINR